MTPPRHDAVGTVRLTDCELEAMLARAAEEGARWALSDVGLGGKDAVLTIHDMRSLLECIQFVRRTAVHDDVAGIRDAFAPPKPELTASVGLATYPMHATEVDGLISVADKALYAAKANRVRFSASTPGSE